MPVLALDSAVSRCSATVVADGQVVAGRQQDLDRGHATVLAAMTQACLRDAGITAAGLDLVGVTVGPGSFTGIRGGIALAQGIGLAAGCPVIGVTVREALADSLPIISGRTLWCAIPSRRGRVFLDTGDAILSLAVTGLPDPPGPIAVAGPAAAEVAARLAARGADVMLTDAALPTGRHVASVAERRFRGALPPLAAEPLYVDAPEARLPGERPPATRL
ncbi:tRNA (adenosine(37)-N6)-threonylcarbamoyltransferase complex dimerization subunit type 1 TsaB [Rhodopila globiformis]|uniref:tRNA (Adenosine(37)-N6)-threonylcarbamoyltransferase complex dimerization subunit type 1 TsaB n=1 Tax=Rhodopila globiformis TaxID=1071 RepID=A0A2S6N3H9_RHOGL|nr:tRNA (adenosine(37)-N6)-threonylcarbamoyltransferase complex dimerization subunit type 1 TsaB [Rhodopila globiformis]PPQ29170.1 tRNA (adenosine(37)-N6)-threonylcarbamoyltransferase complex dimerization subunit type 1 TsaB [Rhodopila globiformis]